MLKNLIGLIVVMAFVSSCIPNERIIYMQNKADLPELGLDTLITTPRKEYFLQPRDILSVTFFSNVDEAVQPFRQTTSDIMVQLNQQQQGGGGNVGNLANQGQSFVIDNNGNLIINTLEPIPATDLTTGQLAEEVERLIRTNKGVLDISVNVSLAGIRFTTLGEINAGEQIISGSEANILEAIAAAGDLTINADREKIAIIRSYEGGIKWHEVDLTDRRLAQSEFFFIRPGDIIYAPPLKLREIGAGDNFLSQLSSVIAIISGALFFITLVGNN